MIPIYFGTFAPLHKGHMSIVDKVLNKYGRIHIVCCGYHNDKGELYGIDIAMRTNLVKEQYQNNTNVTVSSINDDDLSLDQSMSDKNWKIWCNVAISTASATNHILFGNKDAIFITSEPEYYEAIKRSGFGSELYSREEIQISGSTIRENPKKYRDMIASSFIDEVIYKCSI